MYKGPISPLGRVYNTPQGPQGEVGMTWRGAYNGGTAYSVNDSVSYNGSSFICTAESTGNLPTDTDYWDILASGGTDVAGPVSSTDNAIPRWNGTGGNVLQNSGVTIDDSDIVQSEGGYKGGSFSEDTFKTSFSNYRNNVLIGSIDNSGGNHRVKAQNSNSLQLINDGNKGLEINDDDSIDLVDGSETFGTNFLSTLLTYFQGIVSTLLRSWDGWMDANETWTYVSATSFKVSGINVTSKYTKGTKIKLTNNSAVKTYYVVSSTFSTDTTITITGETDLVSGAITLPYYSYADCPQGFKRMEDYYKCAVKIATSNQGPITDNAFTKVQLNSEDYDPNSNFDNATNYRWTAPIDMTINVCASLITSGATARIRGIAWIYKNGIAEARGSDIFGPAGTNVYTSFVSKTFKVSKGDYIELYGYINTGANDGYFAQSSFMSVQPQGL